MVVVVALVFAAHLPALTDPNAEIRWLPPATGLASPTELRLQRSPDLRLWENIGAKQRLPAGAPGERVLANEEGEDKGFYRLLTRAGAEFTSDDGAEILGYADTTLLWARDATDPDEAPALLHDCLL